MIWEFGHWGYFSFVVLMGTAAWAFMRMRKKPLGQAALLTVTIGWIYMPAGAALDLPLFPPLPTTQLVTLAAFIGVYMHHRSTVASAKLLRRFGWLLALMALCRTGNFLTNRDPIVFNAFAIPPLTPFDIVSGLGGDTVEIMVPLVLGYVAFRSRKDAYLGFLALVMVGLSYIPFIYYELRMAPVLQSKVYGYRPFSNFSQSIRDGGYRPQVFLEHGLVLGIVWLTVLLGLAAMYRLQRRRIGPFPTGLLLVVCLVTHVLIKAKAALVLAVLAVPLVVWAKPIHMVRVAALFGLLTYVYPVLYMTGNFPDDKLVEWMEPFGEDRVGSMRFRFDNELIMTERAMQRVWFGWGGYGRDRIYDERTGRSLVVQDGYWIILFGLKGITGYVVIYGLYTFPLFAVWWRFKRLRDKRDQVLVGTMALILANMVFNSIPNMSMQVMPYLFGGALLSLLTQLPAEERRERLAKAKQAAAAPTPQSVNQDTNQDTNQPEPQASPA